MKGENLHLHYTTTFKDSNAITNFIKENKPFKMTIKNNSLYYDYEGENDKEKIFDIDVSKSYATSDLWLYDKIIDVKLVFPNVAGAKLSSEMTSLYVCIVIASVFNGVFEEELEEVIKNYDLKNWCRSDDSKLDFKELSSQWIQIGSKTIKMIAAAAKYAISREKQKKATPVNARFTTGKGFRIK